MADSSNIFGDKMGQGWVDGLSYFRGDFNSELNVVIERTRREQMGDIDAVFEFSSPVVIKDILPRGHCRIISLAKLKSGQFPRSCFYLCEIKRSCSEINYRRKVDQFVSFYRELTTKGNKLDSWRPIVKRALADTSTILVFLFNGEDSTVVTAYLHQQTCGTINGYRVVGVWCPSEALIRWDEEQTVADLKQRVADQAQRINLLEEQLKKRPRL